MHFCKWCKKRMSGSHRQHRDNPNYKSKMQIEKEDICPLYYRAHFDGSIKHIGLPAELLVRK